MNDLYPRWQSAWALAGLPEPARDSFDALCQAHAEPQRRYHTLQHLHECLGQEEHIAQLAERPGEVLLALWFHDAVYDPLGRSNEERSARWARAAVVAAGDHCAAERVYQLVMATAHRAVPSSRDAQVVVDVDLSILGADAARFEEYERQVRDEYRHVPSLLFRSKRSSVLRGFLAQERIFNTDSFHQRLEARARANLQHSIAQLSG